MHEVRTGNDRSASDGKKTSAWAYKAHVLHSMQEGAAIHFIRKEGTMAKNVQDLLVRYIRSLRVLAQKK